MKIKNSVKSISPDASIIIMCAALLVLCPVRIFQMLKSIDTTTGFFYDYSSISIIILYSVLALAGVLMLILTFLSGRVPAALAVQGKRIPLGISSLLFAATLFYDALSSYIPDLTSGATIIQNAQSVSLLHHAQAIFAFIACCYLVIFSISYLTGKSYHKKLRLLSLSPLVWAIICVLERITIIISIMRVSELFLELISLIFLMMFFLSFARVSSGINCKGSMWSIIACGCISAMVILTFSVPRIMLVLTGNDDSLVLGYGINFAFIGAAIFILAYVITTLRKGYTIEDVEKMNLQLEANQAKAEQEKELSEAHQKINRDKDGNIIFTQPETNDTEISEE